MDFWDRDGTSILKESIGLAMQFRLSLQNEINNDLKPIEDKILKEILGKSINVYYKIKVQIQRIHSYNSNIYFLTNTITHTAI